MLSLDTLRAYGANVEEAMSRCMNMETFYLRLVRMALADKSFDELEAALKGGDWKTAFEKAHSLKGVLGNLALNPMSQPVSELTERLRPLTACPYEDLLEEILTQKGKLTACL